MYDQDIIEKKPTSPMATALLSIAAACLIGGMVLQGIMLKRYTHSTSGPTASALDWEKQQKAGKEAKRLLADD